MVINCILNDSICFASFIQKLELIVLFGNCLGKIEELIPHLKYTTDLSVLCLF